MVPVELSFRSPTRFLCLVAWLLGCLVAWSAGGWVGWLLGWFAWGPAGHGDQL